MLTAITGFQGSVDCLLEIVLTGFISLAGASEDALGSVVVPRPATAAPLPTIPSLPPVPGIPRCKVGSKSCIAARFGESPSCPLSQRQGDVEPLFRQPLQFTLLGQQPG